MHITTEMARTPEDVKRIVDFGASFDHLPTGRYPLMFIRSGLEAVGYAEIVTTPIIAVGLKPGNAKACMAAIRKLKAWQECQHGECLTAGPLSSPLTPYASRLGFENMGLVLYRSA